MSLSKTTAWSLIGIGVVAGIRAWVHRHRQIDFRGKTVVITGGSRGLGLVMARQFARQGARVAICARDEAELSRAKGDIQLYADRPDEVLTFVCDVTDREQTGQFIRAVEERLGPVDVLVNNAGVIMVSPLQHVQETDLRDAMEVNFWGAVHTIDAVLPGMRARRQGRIVTIASVGGKVSIPHLLPYSVSKFALVGYSEGLRPELAREGIYVTTVCPGLMRTGSPVHAEVKGQPEKEYAWFKIIDSLPLLTVSAESAARDILTACRAGNAQLIVSVPAKLLTLFHDLLPELTADVLTLVSMLLPGPSSTPAGDTRVMGKSSETGLSQTRLSALTDEAARLNNEVVR